MPSSRRVKETSGASGDADGMVIATRPTLSKSRCSGVKNLKLGASVAFSVISARAKSKKFLIPYYIFGQVGLMKIVALDQ